MKTVKEEDLDRDLVGKDNNKLSNNRIKMTSGLTPDKNKTYTEEIKISEWKTNSYLSRMSVAETENNQSEDKSYQKLEGDNREGKEIREVDYIF